jgi:hypothetical protein
MKRLILMMTVIIFSMPLLVTAQQIKEWDFGISAEFGKDYYDRNYPSEYDKYPDMRRSFQSNYSWGVGIWTERHLNARFSGIVRINYMQKDMHPDEYGEPSRTANKWFIKEKHHHVIADIDGRWYINPNSKIKTFIDVKAGVNGLMAIDLYEHQDGKSTNRAIYGYNRWQPIALVAAGVTWKRLALSLEYNRDLKRAENSVYVNSILRQGLTVKTSFAVLKP